MTDTNEVVYQGYTREQLHEAFSKVENKDNWKMPINAKVGIFGTHEDYNAFMDKVIAAISFYAGGCVTVDCLGVLENKDGKVIGFNMSVKAPGYYNLIGS